MKQTSTLLVAMLLFAITSSSHAQISGTVFRDFNGNGVKDNSTSFNEPFVQGVTVKATLSSGTSFLATTDASGAYSFTVGQIPAASAVRIEFSGIATGDYASTQGSGNGTNVQFATAPSLSVNFAVNAPDDYWDNVSNPDPTLLLVQEPRGVFNGYNAGRFSVLQITNSTHGPDAPSSSSQITGADTALRPALFGQTGTVYGLAYQKKQQRFFTVANLKRTFGFGPLGAGGVYFMDKSGSNFTYTGSFNLQGVTPSNGGSALDFGSVTRVTSPTTDANYISGSASGTSKSHDNDAFAKVTTMSFGGIAGYNDSLYAINLYQKKLIVIDASGTSATLNSASVATLNSLVKAYDLASLPGYPTATGAGNTLRPFGIKIYKGRGYIGVVSDAMSTQLLSDLKGYILSFDINNISAGFTTAVTIDFSNFTGANVPNPWVSTWTQAGGGATTTPKFHVQPIISDIEFNEDGSMDIGIRDRWGDQNSVDYDANTVAGSPSTHSGQTVEQGDLLHACWNGTSWVMEGTAGSCTQLLTEGDPTISPYNPVGIGNSYNKTGKEWYGDVAGDGEYESGEGSLAKLMGSQRIVSTAYDPIGDALQPSSNYWNTQGLHWNNTVTGRKTQMYRSATSATIQVNKVNGMGDIEFVTSPQPIQVGNRIWKDSNGNGLQDAGETTAGVPTGTTVTLRSPGVDGIFDNADDQTWTTTTDAYGNYYFSALSSADNRKPATWTGVGNTILPGKNYRIEVAVPSGKLLTLTDANSNASDNIDNDAILNNSKTTALVTFNTSNTNHNFDIGLQDPASLGDKVWRDDNKNGIQDAGEPGVSGITVDLYMNGLDGLAGTSDDILAGSTVTDAYGNYLFSNLVPSINAQTEYSVRVTPPANYVFSTQTNTSDYVNGAETSTDINGSDVNVLGISHSVNLSSGENERYVDAGIILTTQSALSSIGDKVWFDTNGDGNQDSGEPGVSGVTVSLYDGSGNIISVTTTDANGNYIFNNLSNGTYVVSVSAPGGTVLTNSTGTTPGNATTNSDVDPVTGKTSSIIISTSGTVITGIDAGIKLNSKGVVGDFVWNDLNHDGIQDAGEPGIPGVSMQLYAAGANGIIGGGDDILIGITTTDATGYYIFNNLDPAKYFVVATPVAGYTKSSADNGTDDTKDNDFVTGSGIYSGKYVSALYTLPTSLGGLTRDMTIDLGLYNTTSNLNVIGDKVWNDVNANGVQDAGEVGVENVTVRLLNGSGVAVNNPSTGMPNVTLTDANGNYKFVDLADGNYIVEFANIPVGYNFTGQNTAPGVANNDATDSDPNIVSGRTGIVNLDAAGTNSASVIDLTVDAGIVATPAATASLGNRVWYDLNNNGKQDAGELGVSGVKVELLDGIGTAVNVPNTSTPYIVTTNSLGEYMFTGLAAGDYKVRFSTIPAGYTSSPKDAVSNDDITDSDGSTWSGVSTGATVSSTDVYTLSYGEENLNLDLGIVPASGTNTLGNYVWLDINNDGIQQVSEIGVPGVMVSLYNNGADGLPNTSDDVLTGVTATNSNGLYSFAGLTDGLYNVIFSNLPSGMNFTTQNAGGSTAANGSDPDASGKTATIDLDNAHASAAGVTNLDIDAGLITSKAALGNYVWYDANKDGIQDAAETGIAGVSVTLYGSDGTTVLASAVTDANGYYLFTDLNAGSYVIGFSTIPASLEFTQQNTPGDNQNNTNSDADPVTGKTSVIVLSAGEVDLTVDAGIRPKSRAGVGDFVWNDLNNNGVQNIGEPGVPGVIITLYNASDNIVGTAVTDGNGKYLISNIVPGNGYYIIFSNLPTSAQLTLQTSDVSAGDVTLGSDADQSTGKTAIFNLSAGQYLPTIDAGIIKVQILPVNLQNFTAVPLGSNVMLNWSVSQEINTSSYEVEFSGNGVNYKNIGYITATNVRNYGFEHTNPVIGVNYYRLKITGKDGSISYSKVETVRFDESMATKISVKPNPFVKSVDIDVKLKSTSPVKVYLFDASGKIVYQSTVQCQTGENRIRIDQLNMLTAGEYIIQVNNGSSISVKKLVKLK